jgi:hypothetical protein
MLASIRVKRALWSNWVVGEEGDNLCNDLMIPSPCSIRYVSLGIP